MADDEDDDLYEEEFDFVDDEDEDEDDEEEQEEDLDDDADDSEVGEGSDEEDSLETEVDQADRDERDVEDVEEGAEVDEYGRPSPTANYVVHIYEYSKLKRTIDRPFTPEEAEAFCTEYNRTGKSYGRVSVAGKNDVKPKKALEQSDATALD